MSRDTINDFSSTESDNTDVGGVGIAGSNKPSNLDNGIRQWLAIWNKFVVGTDAILSSFRVKDTTDSTKKSGFDLSKQATGTTRLLDTEALYRNGAFIETIHTTSGTHTFAASSRYFQIYAVGGGAGGGGADGQGVSFKGAASGGSSGFFGRTGRLEIGALATGTVTIGTAGGGGAGASGANGSNGGNTTWDDGTNSFTWGGGRGGQGIIADTNFAGMAGPPNRPTSTGTLYGSSDRATLGYLISATSFSSAPAKAFGGIGGNSPWGQGGSGGDVSAGSAAVGYGAGGGGASVYEVNTNYAGGDGTAGILIVLEW
jgi:hypothetical protein